MNLFGGGAKPQEVKAPPSIDESRQRVEQLQRGRQLRGRAATMLSQGQGATQTAQTKVTGS